MVNVAIVGNGPSDLVPNLSLYREEIDVWIGADRGALILLDKGIHVDFAVGDFDSINQNEKQFIKSEVKNYRQFPTEKNETDIELALMQAFQLHPKKIYLFGVTGGRLDHELINIQLLFTIISKGIQGVIVDQYNLLELTTSGDHQIKNDEMYTNISFVPYTQNVKGLTLTGFYYPLENEDISWGSTRCISNKLLSNKGNFYYEEGILLLIKSRDMI